jgi:DHA1 family tetracycline resistance protein-like MFS transporter
MSSLQSFANIFGPLIGGSVFAYFVSPRSPVELPGAPFFVEAVLCGLGVLVAAWALARFGLHIDHHTGPTSIALEPGAAAAEEAPSAEPA